MGILKPLIKSGTQLFGQATCVFLHAACPNSNLKINASLGIIAGYGQNESFVGMC